jgi:hypothetical protein
MHSAWGERVEKRDLAQVNVYGISPYPDGFLDAPGQVGFPLWQGR